MKISTVRYFIDFQRFPVDNKGNFETLTNTAHYIVIQCK